ncbi:MAG: hypothetical protein WCK35_12055 [Chloroflexota bacterium]
MTKPDKDKKGIRLKPVVIPPGGSYVLDKEGNEIKMPPETKKIPVKKK